MLGIIVFILVLSLVIIIHELGHFLAARRAGILCHEFSLGMGPVIWKTKKGETTYCVRAIPIGGYVSMAGEEIESDIINPGDKVRVLLNNKNQVTKLIIDQENDLYDNEELITVEQVDLKGIDGGKLYINEYEVVRDAFYVLKGKEIQIAPADRNFNFKNKKQRFLAIFGGPFMNFVLAFFIFVLYAIILGFPNYNSTEIGLVGEGYPAEGELLAGDVIKYIDHDPVTAWYSDDDTVDSVNSILNANKGDRVIEFIVERDGVEETVYVTPIISFYSVGFSSAAGDINDLHVGTIQEGTKAEKAGMQTNDQLVSIDGVTLTSWDDVITAISANTTGEEMVIEVLRDGETTIELTVEEPWNEDVLTSQGLNIVETRVGINPVFEFDFFRSLGYGFTGIKNSSTLIFDTLRLLFSNDQVGAGDLAGPVGIYQLTASALDGGIVSLLGWIGLLSVNLGFINLLPIPALDGGRLVFLGWEALTGKKANQKVENTLHYVMYLMLMGLFVFITYNDILRLIGLK